MEFKYLTIGIKGLSIEEIEKWLKSCNIFCGTNNIKKLFGIDISLKDLRENFYTMKKFLEENDLKDENPFFNEFEIEPYGLMIDFDLIHDSKHLDILEPIVFVLGQQISSLFGTKCLVMFENMRIPAGLFDNGVLTDVFERFNESYFENKIWRPKTMSN